MRGWLNARAGVALTDVALVCRPAPTRPAASRRSSSILPEGVQADARRRQVAERHAGRGRDRLRASSRVRRPASCRGTRTSCGCFPDYLGDGGGRLQAHQGVADHAYHRRAEARSSTRHPWVARNLSTPSRNRSAAASSACSIRRCRAIRSPGCRPTRAGCATCSAATRSPSASRRIARRSSSSLLYTYEQGIAHRHAKPEELFPKGVMTLVRV